jgi:flagellar biosynthesis protein
MVFKRVDLTQKKSSQRNQATALAYIPEQDDAPRVIATGKGLIAEQIIARAKENGIPVHEDPLLAAALSMVDVGSEIPPELYRVVAEILAYVFRIRQQYRP